LNKEPLASVKNLEDASGKETHRHLRGYAEERDTTALEQILIV
jgi:hypothetical protein